MTATTYTLKFENNHGETGNYAVFTAPPIQSGTSTVYSNVWLYFPNRHQGGTFNVQTTTQYYAWVGTSPQSPSPGVKISTGGSAPVTLGTETTGGISIPMVVEQDQNFLDEDHETEDANPGAFAITTGTDFKVPNERYLIGMALVGGGSPIPAPAASILADNNTITEITPVVFFCIAECSYDANTIIEYEELSKDAAQIDFPSNPGCFTATIIHNPDGSFSVTYM